MWMSILLVRLPLPASPMLGSYTKNAHTITYKIEGDYFANAEYEVIENVAYGTELSLIKDDMTQEGYTFSGYD